MPDPYAVFGKYLTTIGKVAIAYSGGFDSTFMLAAASEYIPNNHIAIFVDTPMISERQKRNAIHISERLNSVLVIVELDWKDMPGIQDNNMERCYFCKSAIYSNVKSVASDMGCDICICGDNFDDLKSDRPGRRATEELDIIRPLEDFMITRGDIVNKVRSMDLGCVIVKDTCLSTRIPSGIPIGEESMRLIEHYESVIRDMCGVEQLRFRYFGDHAKIQTSPPEICKLMAHEAELEKYFQSKKIIVDIDPNGYSG